MKWLSEIYYTFQVVSAMPKGRNICTLPQKFDKSVNTALRFWLNFHLLNPEIHHPHDFVSDLRPNFFYCAWASPRRRTITDEMSDRPPTHQPKSYSRIFCSLRVFHYETIVAVSVRWFLPQKDDGLWWQTIAHALLTTRYFITACCSGR